MKEPECSDDARHCAAPHAPLSPAAVMSSRTPDRALLAAPVEAEPAAMAGFVVAAASRATSLRASTDVCAMVLAGPRNCRISAAARQAVSTTLPMVQAPPKGEGSRRTDAPARGGTQIANASAADRQRRSPEAAVVTHAACRSPPLPLPPPSLSRSRPLPLLPSCAPGSPNAHAVTMSTRKDVASAMPVTAVNPVAVCADVREEKVNSAGDELSTPGRDPAAAPDEADGENADDDVGSGVATAASCTPISKHCAEYVDASTRAVSCNLRTVAAPLPLLPPLPSVATMERLTSAARRLPSVGRASVVIPGQKDPAGQRRHEGGRPTKPTGQEMQEVLPGARARAPSQSSGTQSATLCGSGKAGMVPAGQRKAREKLPSAVCTSTRSGERAITAPIDAATAAASTLLTPLPPPVAALAVGLGDGPGMNGADGKAVADAVGVQVDDGDGDEPLEMVADAENERVAEAGAGTNPLLAGEPVAAGVPAPEPVPDAAAVLVGEPLAVCDGEAPIDALALLESVIETLAVVVPVPLRVTVADAVRLPVPVPELVPVAVPVTLPVVVTVAVPVMEAVPVGVPVPLALSVCDRVAVPVAVSVPVPVAGALPVSVAVPEGVTLGSGEADPLAVVLPVSERVGVLQAVAVADAVSEPLPVPVAEAVDVAVAVPLSEPVAVAVADALVDTDTLGVPDGDADGDVVAVAVPEGLADGVAALPPPSAAEPAGHSDGTEQAMGV